jgi:hypothetical protein
MEDLDCGQRDPQPRSLLRMKLEIAPPVNRCLEPVRNVSPLNRCLGESRKIPWNSARRPGNCGPVRSSSKKNLTVRPCIAFLSRRHSPFKSRNSENLCLCELDQRVRIRSSEVEPWTGNGGTGKEGCVQLPPGRNPWPFAYIKIGHIRWSYGQELLRRTQRLAANRNLWTAVQNRDPYPGRP